MSVKVFFYNAGITQIKKKYIVKDSITINEDTLQAALGMECGTQLAIYLFVGGKLCNS